MKDQGSNHLHSPFARELARDVRLQAQTSQFARVQGVNGGGHMKGILHVVLLGGALTWVTWKFGAQPWTPGRLAWLLLCVPAFALWATARIQLGSSFAMKAKAQELVTHGLYSKIRNPIYVFGFLFIAGYVLLVGKPIWLLAGVVVVPVQIVRSQKEAKVLEEKFGDAYREYRRKTWF